MRQSDRVVVPGSRTTLTAEINLPAGVHVYAPGVSGYKPIQLEIQPQSGIELAEAQYPKSKTLYLPVIKERVPVFEGKFRIAADATISATPDLMRSLGAEGKPLTVAGELHYQACDAKTCYVPASIPVHWQLQVTPLDTQRAPEAIRHQ
ncbi:MAG TPA: protein-disulfide reductase DsbD domain-containing protein [Candidatus Acidoferrales bacterium]|nr:protein-disulfide reductase DsbD domain-containing protein [Candidatus Acidoferrales bacterium]